MNIDQIDTWISELRYEMQGADNDEKATIRQQIAELRKTRDDLETEL